MQTKALSLTHIVQPATHQDQKPGVVFMMHGYGSNEEDLFSFAPEMPKELCIISVRAPYPMQPYGNAWYAINFDAVQGKWSDDVQAQESRDALVSFIDEACLAYELDSSNVSLLGFSQGTILSYAVALSYPEKIKNVIGLSGYINKDIIMGNVEDKKYDHLGIYASHGSVDQVIPVSWAQRVPETLSELNIAHVYEEFPVGHGVAPQNFYSFKAWLEKRL